MSSKSADKRNLYLYWLALSRLGWRQIRIAGFRQVLTN